MRTLTVLVVTTLTAALASPTAAARVELRGIELRAGPAIAGEGFAFAEEPRRDRLAVRLVGPDGAVRALPQFDPLLRQGRADERYVALEASASRIAVGFTLQGFVDTPAGFDRAVNRLGEIQAAAPDGPTGRLVRCRDEARLAGSLAVDGNAVAYDNPECASGRVGIREYAAAGPQTQTISTGALTLRFAGRFVAVDRGDDVAVFDRTTQQLVVSAPAEIDRYVGTPLGFDVQTDGTLLIEAARPGGCVLEWYSVAEPHAHPLPYRPRCGSLVRLSDGRILFDQLVDRDTQLSVGDLAGTTPRPVATRLPGVREGTVAWTAPTGERDPGFDLDGDRFAYGDPDCAGTKLVSDTLTAALERAPSPLEQCPARIEVARRVRVTRHGSFRVRVICRNGCEGLLHVERRGTGRGIGLRGDSYPRVRPGDGSTRMIVRLSRAELLRLRRVRRTCVDLILRAKWPDGRNRDVRARTCLLAPRR